MPRRLLSAAAACTLLFGLAACGEGGDGPVTTPPPEIDIGGSSDGGGETGASDGGGDVGDPNAASEVPAPDPADYPGMDENTPDGAEQAFRFYIAVSMWSHQTGNDQLLNQLEGPDCSGCAELNADLPKLQEAQRYWGELTLEDDFLEAFEGEVYDQEVSYYFILSEHEEPDLEGGGVISVGETEYVTTGGMVWSGDSWVVNGLQGEWGADAFDRAG